MKDRMGKDCCQSGAERICSVSTKFAQFPWSSMPRRRYLSPDLLVDRREIKVKRKDCSFESELDVSAASDESFVGSFTIIESEASFDVLANVKAL